MFPSLFILLYVAHLLSDYPFQTDHQAKCKAGWTDMDTRTKEVRHHHGWGANLTHAGTHTLTTAAALGVGALVLDLPLTVPAAVTALLWIGATHAFIDRRWPVARWMKFARQAGWAQHGGAAHVDQTAHITALAIAALAMAGLS
ncbi:DUF3307 domain-containing protein [Streptomyces rubiginosohelvolus]|uniref:DUF3307 domain-containing protein n=1 Tax=Streptomyces rubiginosohelvolus TaxID=67362 RepID=UPI0035D59565